MQKKYIKISYNSLKHLILLILIYQTLSSIVYSEIELRLKELVDIKGARGNQLFGYGLVVGLNGTGDQTQTVFTAQSLTNMLDKLGVAPSKITKFGLSTSGSEMKVKNVAAVLVTAELSPFIRSGSKIDVTVSSIGDSKSLEGGTLVMTPLQAANGKIYAVAQGPISIGGLSANATTPAHPTVANIPMGAFVEKEVPVTFFYDNKLLLALKEPDFTMSKRIAEKVNEVYPGIANALDGGTVELMLGEEDKSSLINFISEIEQLKVKADMIAKVVINERTGTIVAGENVKISNVAVSHGFLTVNITQEVNEEGRSDGIPMQSKVIVVKDAVTIGEVAKSLRTLGAGPTDMIAIFQAMLKSGALKAKLEIM